MVGEKSKESKEDLEVVPLQVVLGELEIIKQKLYNNAIVLSKPDEDTKDEIQKTRD